MIRALATLSLCLALPLAAQEFRDSETLRSHRRATALLDAALAAHGGRDRVVAPPAMTIEFDGTHHLPLQNRAPDFTRDAHRKRGEVVVDGESIAYEEHIERPGVYTGRHRLVASGSGAYDLNLRSRQYRPATAAAVAARAEAYLPHRALAAADANRQGIRALGATSLTFGHPSGRAWTLHFDPKSKTLAAVEVLAHLPLYGDRTVRHEYDDYAAVEGLLLPRIRRSQLDGARTETVSLAARAGVDAGAFAVPEGFLARDDGASRAERALEVHTLAPGVVAIANAERTDASVLAIAQADGVVVAGAPGGVTDAVHDAIGRAFPSTPIKLVVPTHAHSDHAGGVRDWIARGAPLLARPASARFYAEVSRAPHTLHPDALARAPREPRIVSMPSPRHRLDDATRPVEVHDLGPTSHADEMLVVYVPHARVLYQADLFEVDDDDAIDANTANAVTVELLRRLETLGLGVETIVGAEGRRTTRAELERAVALRERGPRWSDAIEERAGNATR